MMLDWLFAYRRALVAAAIAALMAASFVAGWRVAGWRAAATALANAQEQAAQHAAALERVAGVSAAYQQVVAELRRLDATNRVETIREINRVEYRCGLPADGQRLLDTAVTAANKAAGGPAPALPADRPAADR